MSKLVDVLSAARDLYASAPSHAVGRPEPGTYCVLTATWYAAGAAGLPGYDKAADRALREAVGREGLVRWGAESSTEIVLAGFDAAIEQAKPTAELEGLGCVCDS
jgi:hypothetical protein